MAYFDDLLDQQDKSKTAPGGDPGGAFIQGASPTAGGTNAPKPTSSGSFTNLQSYLDANKGQDAAIGQGVENVVGTDTKAADAAGTAYTGNATKAIDAGTAKTDPNLIKQIQTSPTQVDKGAFTTAYNASYTGETDPTKFDGYGDLTSATQHVGDDNKLLNGDLDQRGTLVRKAFDRPSYTQGENRLDSFLLGAGDEGSKSLGRAQQSAGGYGQKAADAQASVTKQITDARQTSADTQTATRNAYTGAVGAKQLVFDPLKAKVAADNKAATDATTFTKGQLASKDPASQAVAEREIGLDPGTAAWLQSQGYDLSQLITAGKAKSLGDVANGQDVTDYNALLGLTGQVDDRYGGFTKAGGSDTPYTVDNDKITQSHADWLAQLATHEPDTIGAPSETFANNHQTAANFTGDQWDPDGFGMPGSQNADYVQPTAPLTPATGTLPTGDGSGSGTQNAGFKAAGDVADAWKQSEPGQAASNAQDYLTGKRKLY